MGTLLLVFGIIIIDQVTKVLVRSLMTVGESIPVLGEFLSIDYVQNTGVAFGLLRDRGWIVTLVQIIVIILIGILLIKSTNLTKHSDFFLAMILAGGIGNLFDRIILGYVTDMISFSFFPPVFNVADIAVTLGSFFLLIELVRDLAHED